MKVNDISKNNFTLNSINEKKSTGQDVQFKNVLSDILTQTMQNDVMDKTENINFMVGESSDTHNTLIAAEKADISLLLTVEIRNKIMEAYQEIMRMQI